MSKDFYIITLYDYNCSPIADGVVRFYTEDIQDFYKRWSTLCPDKEEVERFERSWMGEIVTDYYTDSPDYDIVQQRSLEICYTKHIEKDNTSFIATNAYDFPETYYVNHWNADVLWVKDGEKYVRLVKYECTGVCMENMFFDNYNRYRTAHVYGNPVVESSLLESNYASSREFFKDVLLRSICYVVTDVFDNEPEMYDDWCFYDLSKEDMGVLFEDVIGEAG